MRSGARGPAGAEILDPALAEAWDTLVRGANRHEYGGAVALVARRGEILLHRATGWAVREPIDQRSAMAIDTIFDLASLTKVVATTPVILSLVAGGRLRLDQPAGEILPEFGTAGRKAGVTIERLLTHAAGFTAGIPIRNELSGEAAYLREFAATQPEREPGLQVVYGDLSFLMLGAVAHRVTHEEIDATARRMVFAPLGMSDTMFTPPAALRGRIAATEYRRPASSSSAAVSTSRHPLKAVAVVPQNLLGSINAMRGSQPASPGNQTAHGPAVAGQGSTARPGRNLLIRGQVHDGHAWYGFGGVAGSAGLFGTALDLYRYGQMWLNGGRLVGVRLLPEHLVAEAASNRTTFAPDGASRGYGWRLLPPPGTPEGATPESGRGLSQQAFGHTGFTGTSLWIDPAHGIVIVVLTNRLHPVPSPAYQETRARFAAAVAAALR